MRMIETMWRNKFWSWNVHSFWVATLNFIALQIFVKNKWHYLWNDPDTFAQGPLWKLMSNDLPSTSIITISNHSPTLSDPHVFVNIFLFKRKYSQPPNLTPHITLSFHHHFSFFSGTPCLPTTTSITSFPILGLSPTIILPWYLFQNYAYFPENISFLLFPVTTWPICTYIPHICTNFFFNHISWWYLLSLHHIFANF